MKKKPNHCLQTDHPSVTHLLQALLNAYRQVDAIESALQAVIGARSEDERSILSDAVSEMLNNVHNRSDLLPSTVLTLFRDDLRKAAACLLKDRPLAD